MDGEAERPSAVREYFVERMLIGAATRVCLLFYEQFPWGMSGGRFRRHAGRAPDELGLGMPKQEVSMG